MVGTLSVILTWSESEDGALTVILTSLASKERLLHQNGSILLEIYSHCFKAKHFTTHVQVINKTIINY